MFSKKSTFLFIILAFFCCLFVRFVHSGEKIAKVRFVYDGDTILLSGGEKVRYLGINTPELDPEGNRHEFMAIAARKFNIKLVKGKRVRLEFDRKKKDKYGRLLAYVYLVKTGEMVNVLMLKNGMAYCLLKRPNIKYKDLFLRCQREAMQKRIGIWSRPFKNDERFYVGNKYSFKFHRPGCPFGKRMNPKNRVIFKNCYEAFWNGYSPCKRCKPAVYE